MFLDFLENSTLSPPDRKQISIRARMTDCQLQLYFNTWIPNTFGSYFLYLVNPPVVLLYFRCICCDPIEFNCLDNNLICVFCSWCLSSLLIFSCIFWHLVSGLQLCIFCTLAYLFYCAVCYIILISIKKKYQTFTLYKLWNKAQVVGAAAKLIQGLGGINYSL